MSACGEDKELSDNAKLFDPTESSRLAVCEFYLPHCAGAVVPVITIWLGVFPLVISGDLAIALTILGVTTCALMYRVRTFR